MSTPPVTIQKTCASCGVQKPLSAFMQINGPEGTTYTNICSDCRQQQRDIVKEPTEFEESTRSGTGYAIDAKSKVVADNDKIELRKQVEDEYFDEREKDEILQQKVDEKKQSFLKNEKEHRTSFLNRSSFLDSNKRNTNVNPGNIQGTAAHAQEAERFNFQAPFEDTRTPQLKHSGVVYNQFKSWLGKSAPISNPGTARQAAETPTKEDVIEYVDRHWSPNKKP